MSGKRSWDWFTQVPVRFITLLAVGLWLLLAAGWSWYIVQSDFNHAVAERCQDFETHLLRDIRSRLLAVMTTPHGEPAAEWYVDDTLQDALSDPVEHDNRLAYIMVWDARGRILAHSSPEIAGDQLPPAQWPNLEDDQDRRQRVLKRLPWSTKPVDVWDVTSELRYRGKRLGFLSIGLVRPRWEKEVWDDTRFWEQQWRPLATAAVLTLAGAALLVGAMYWARRMMQRARELHEQSVRARTSLLTERGMLASVLAHEIRSPLTALRFNLHSLRSLLAAKSTDSTRQINLTDSCEREIRRLDLMLSDFLMRTQVVAPAESTSVNQVVHEALDFLRPQLEGRGIRLVRHLDPADPHVSVNADELRQVLLNLTVNAQDAMPKGGTLVVSTVVEESAVVLLVRDSGVGIPPEVLERIFEPFFSTKPQGSGLGLALVRRVVSGAGGTVNCQSTPGEGTTFRLVLPRAEEPGAAPAPDLDTETAPPDDPEIPQTSEEAPRDGTP